MMKQIFISLFLVFSILSCDKKEISDEDEFSLANPTEQEKDFYPSGIPETVSHFYTATVYPFGQVHLARLGKFS